VVFDDPGRWEAAPAIDLSPVKPASFQSAPVEITGNGLDIPKFLCRAVATAGGGAIDDAARQRVAPAAR
jgi:hypothetical protein